MNHNEINIRTGNGDVTHRECTSSLEMHSLTGNGDVLHWECTSSLGMEMWLTGNAHPDREWECVPHQKSGCDSPGMHILTGNAHSLYRVKKGN